jgi:VIT1/CCC1 family predicted Fe2+/Mn2+ transporter
MLRDGPIPIFVHGLIEYAVGVLFIIAPFLFNFDSGAATALSIIVGVAVITITATSGLPTSLIGSISRPAHVVLDYLLAVLLIASPFVFGFSDETGPTVFFIALGLAHLLITIGTRFREPKSATG